MVGENFRFGFRAAGDVATLEELGSGDFKVQALPLLTDGTLQGDVVECPLHGGRFCVRTGAGLGPPIPCDLRTYEVRVHRGEIELKLPDLF